MAGFRERPVKLGCTIQEHPLTRKGYEKREAQLSLSTSRYSDPAGYVGEKCLRHVLILMF